MNHKSFAFRLFMGLGGLCGVICGEIIFIHALIGFLPVKVENPWLIAGIGLLAGLNGFYTLVEKVNGSPL